MADSRYLISDERSRAGQRILEMTDSVGFAAFAAGWIHDIPTNTWRYLLSTPMLKARGPLWVYRRLNTVFRHIPLPDGISPLDIYVISPELEIELFGDQASIGPLPGRMIKVDDPKVSAIILAINQDICIEQFEVTNGFVTFYRKLTQAARRRVNDPSRTFDHKVSQLARAA